MIVAIDGPAGSGKSTIAQKLAEGLGFTYINSGSIYRAMTLRTLRFGIDANDPNAVVLCSSQANIEYRNGMLFLDGAEAEADLRSKPVDSLVAQLSAIPELREIVNEIVRRIAGAADAVVEGRDMTTVVFPEADAKFYLDASADARARRRHSQGTSEASLDEIRANIAMRDEIDRTKSVGPSKSRLMPSIWTALT